MNGGALLWVVLCGISAVLFFGIAAVVSVRGMGDLRDLLRKTQKHGDENPNQRRS